VLDPSHNLSRLVLVRFGDEGQVRPIAITDTYLWPNDPSFPRRSTSLLVYEKGQKEHSLKGNKPLMQSGQECYPENDQTIVYFLYMEWEKDAIQTQKKKNAAAQPGNNVNE